MKVIGGRAEKDIQMTTAATQTISSGLSESPKEAAIRALGAAGIHQPPVNPLLVAERLGIPVFWKEFEDSQLHGSSSVQAGRVRIDVKASDPANRRRFTVAHEIGHILLHMNGAWRASFDDDDESSDYEAFVRREERRTSFDGHFDTKEMEANAFAACLLMPEDWVNEAFGTSSDVKHLASIFSVSSAAMQVRLNSLRLV